MVRPFNRALIAALAGLGLVLAASPAWASGPAQWRLAYQPRIRAVLDSVAAAGPFNAWATGVRYRGQTPVDQPFVIHWAGHGWHAVTIPGAGGFFTDAVRVSSPRNVWIFAHDGRKILFTPEVFRWDGAGWHAMPLPGPVGIGDPVVLSATDVWTIGQANCASTAAGLLDCTTALWHWNGSTWRSRRVATDVTGLAGTSAGQVWAVGLTGETQTGVVQGSIVAYRWNGARWTRASMPHPRVFGNPGVGMSSAADVWLGALIAVGRRGGAQAGFAMHWNGRGWQRLTAPASIGLPDTLGGDHDVVADGHGGVWLGTTVRWTGRSWANVNVAVPSGVAFTFPGMTKIPRTSSYWAAGQLIETNGFRPVIAVFGRVPR